MYFYENLKWPPDGYFFPILKMDLHQKVYKSSFGLCRHTQKQNAEKMAPTESKTLSKLIMLYK
jgi:hypothetical protein